MTNCLFYSVFFALFLNLSLGSLRFSQINRVFMSIYKGMLEASVYTVNDEGEDDTPYYNKAKLETYVDTYLKENISKYATNYEVTTKYLNKDNDLTCLNECGRISITLTADINMFFKYNKTQVFVIKNDLEV